MTCNVNGSTRKKAVAKLVLVRESFRLVGKTTKCYHVSTKMATVISVTHIRLNFGKVVVFTSLYSDFAYETLQLFVIKEKEH